MAAPTSSPSRRSRRVRALAYAGLALVCGWMTVLNALVAWSNAPGTVVAEATAFAMASAAISAAAVRGARRSVRGPPVQPGSGAPAPLADDDPPPWASASSASSASSAEDPLAWARRRRFGAGS